MKTPMIVLLLACVFAAASTQAGSFNNRMVVQGYLKQGGAALSDAAGFPMRFVVKRSSTAVWCQDSAAAVPVVNGVFNALLSGNANCQSLTNALDASVFSHAADSDVFVIDVVVDVSKDGFGGGDDATFAGIDVVSSPLAIHANYANTAGTANTATTATTATSATSVSGVVAVSNGGTGATTASAARTNLGLGTLATINTNASASTYLRGDGTWGTPPGAPVTSVAGKTGVVTLTTTDISGLGSLATVNTNGTATDVLRGDGTWGAPATPPVPVTSVAGKTGDVTLSSTDVSGVAASGANTDITSVNLTGAGTALTVTNNASIGGNLNVTGSISGTLSGGVRQANSTIAPTTGGTTTAYTLTNTPALTTLTSGLTVRFKINATNTGTATLNVDGLGAKNLVNSRTAANVVAGDLIANKFVTASYDGTSWQVDLPSLYFSATALNCGTSVTANTFVVCPNIAASNVNAGDLVHCSPSADPSNTVGRVQWSVFATAGNLSIRLGCSHTANCAISNRDWKCTVIK